MLEAFLKYVPWILLATFFLFSVFVREVRITSCVIVATALINMAMAGLYEQGTTTVFLYKGGIDMITALTLLIIYGTTGARKAPEQAIIFVLFAFSHGWLMYEVFIKSYLFYDYYDYAMYGLTAAHFIVMWNYYEELFKNILASDTHDSGPGWSVNHWLGNRKHRNSHMGSSGRRGHNGDLSGSKLHIGGKKS